MAFAGEVAELPIGIDGLAGTKNLSELGPGHLIIGENIRYDSGTLAKEGGSAKYNSSAISGTPSILGGHDWHPTGTSTQRMVVLLSDGDYKKDTGGADFTVDLATGLTIGDFTNPVFVEGGKEAAANDKKLFMFSASNAVQVLDADGATSGNLATPPADWSGANQPTFGLIHENRMWGGGNPNDPHRMYYSLTTDHEDFTGAGSGTIAVYPGEGEKLVGAISFKGLLICFKYPSGIYVIDTSDAAVANWLTSKHSTSIGGISPNGAIAIDNDVLFIDLNGEFHLISAITEFGNIGTRSLSDIANISEIMLSETNKAEYPNTQAIYYTDKGEAHFTVSESGTAYNRRAVWDLNRRDLPRFRLSNKDENRSIWLYQDGDRIPRPYTGDKGGFVWKLDQANRSKDGSGYSGKWQTSHMDFSHLDPELGTKNKNGRFIELVVEPTGNFDLSVSVVWDDVTHETITFNMGVTGADLGSFVLDTSKLAGSTILNKKKRLTGSGRRLSLIGTNSGDGEDFSVSKFYVGFTRGTDRVI
jgi:hypothetical protein|tara:strand:+ start:5884 stop:7473 length:1590 start_codon:yes stop_codon:yes gene_type:complete